jgi:triosephosphate isomerase
MTKQKLLIVGNWKMHLNVQESSLLVHRLNERIKTQRSISVVLAPSMLALQPLSLEIDRSKFQLAAQDAYYKDDGAFTGEVSFAMLRELVHYVLVGHSERRTYFHETLEVVRDKVAAAIRNEIKPILCVGETKQEREAHETKRVLHDQLTTALSNLTSDEISQVVVAYEPIWAISTFGGELAKPSEVEPELRYIREQISELYGQSVASAIEVLYGGSVDEHVVRGYLELEDCNGVLVGGASINYLKFSEIVAAAERLQYAQLKEEQTKDKT